MVDRVNADIASKPRMDVHSHIRTYDNFLFRELRSGTGSVNEYRHLNKVFWREREAGFSIPEHRVVEDINDNLWLQVKRIEGVPGHKFVTTENHRETIDDFLSSYTGVLEQIIDRPTEPFPSDCRLRQFMCSEESWHLVDLEPRVDYLTKSSYSRANKTFIKSVKRVHEASEEFRTSEKPLHETERVLDSVVEKTRSHSELFNSFPEYQSLQHHY